MRRITILKNVESVWSGIESLANPWTHVYVMDDGEYYKIGISKNPKERKKQIGATVAPRRLRLVVALPAPRSVERELHAKFSSIRISGEWFKRASDIPDAVVEACLKHRPIPKARNPGMRDVLRRVPKPLDSDVVAYPIMSSAGLYRCSKIGFLHAECASRKVHIYTEFADLGVAPLCGRGRPIQFTAAINRIMFDAIDLSGGVCEWCHDAELRNARAGTCITVTNDRSSRLLSQIGSA